MRCTSRWPVERLLAALLASSAVTACAFDEGDPWGVVELAATARFAPDADRRTPEGWLRTSNDYALELHALEVGLGEVVVELAPLGAGALSFDPADPPPGYSLCHNGHCHADDGSLPSYAEIEASLAGGADGGGQRVVGPVGAVVTLGEAPVALPLGACVGCTLFERGELVLAALQIEALTFEATVRDLRGAERQRLAGDVRVRATVALGTELTRGLDGRFDRDNPLGARLTVELALTDGLFDQVEWSELPGVAGATDTVELSAATALAERLRNNLQESESLDVHVERF